MKSPTDNALVAALPPASRSAKTNNRRAFVDGDGRSAWARRRRDLEALYADDVSCGGTLSAFQLGLISTAAALRCELEKLEGHLSVGAEINLDIFGRLVGHYRRVCETLGIERRTKDITTPTLDDIAREIAASKRDEEEHAA